MCFSYFKYEILEKKQIKKGQMLIDDSAPTLPTLAPQKSPQC